MTIKFGFAIRIAAAGAVSRARKRIDIARLKLTIVSHAEWVCAAEIFPQMRRAVRTFGKPFAPWAKRKTDTPSDVSVAVSLERHWFATLSATDPRPGSAENLAKAAPLKHGGRGSDNQCRGAVADRKST